MPTTRTSAWHDQRIADAIAADNEVLLRKVKRRLVPVGMNGCLIWPGTTNGSGAPAFTINGTKVSVQRALFVERGVHPGDGKIIATCSTPHCCALSHLRIEAVTL
jgi:hypothetical protein